MHMRNMVLILDGNTEIGTHVWSNLGYLIWLRILFRSRAVTAVNLRGKKSEKPDFPSYVSYHVI